MFAYSTHFLDARLSCVDKHSCTQFCFKRCNDSSARTTTHMNKIEHWVWHPFLSPFRNHLSCMFNETQESVRLANHVFFFSDGHGCVCEAQFANWRSLRCFIGFESDKNSANPPFSKDSTINCMTLCWLIWNHSLLLKIQWGVIGLSCAMQFPSLWKTTSVLMSIEFEKKMLVSFASEEEFCSLSVAATLNVTIKKKTTQWNNHAKFWFKKDKKWNASFRWTKFEHIQLLPIHCCCSNITTSYDTALVQRGHNWLSAPATAACHFCCCWPPSFFNFVFCSKPNLPTVLLLS